MGSQRRLCLQLQSPDIQFSVPLGTPTWMSRACKLPTLQTGSGCLDRDFAGTKLLRNSLPSSDTSVKACQC